MIDNILSISGKPGLFRLVARGKNMLICESLLDGRRFPAMQRDRVLSLGDIAMYSETEEVPLNTIFANAKALTEGKTAPVKHTDAPQALRDWFAQVMPDYDRDRVRDCDIKKFVQWFNILIETGHDDFSEPTEEETAADIETAAE